MTFFRLLKMTENERKNTKSPRINQNNPNMVKITSEENIRQSFYHQVIKTNLMLSMIYLLFLFSFYYAILGCTNIKQHRIGTELAPKFSCRLKIGAYPAPKTVLFRRAFGAF